MSILLAAAAGLAFGQGEGEKRGSIPPGQSQDGSGPSDGAIKGGSIKQDTGASKSPQRDLNRCKELAGTLQEECLRDVDASASGAAPSKPALAAPLAEPARPAAR